MGEFNHFPYLLKLIFEAANIFVGGCGRTDFFGWFASDNDLGALAYEDDFRWLSRDDYHLEGFAEDGDGYGVSSGDWFSLYLALDVIVEV